MLETKLEIVHAHKKGTSQRLVGDKFGVAKSTITDIWKDRKKISESPAFANKKHCIIHHPKFHLVDSKACWKWFCLQHFKGAPVSGVLLQEKAHSFFAKLYPDDHPQSFRGSNKFVGVKTAYTLESSLARNSTPRLKSFI